MVSLVLRNCLAHCSSVPMRIVLQRYSVVKLYAWEHLSNVLSNCEGPSSPSLSLVLWLSQVSLLLRQSLQASPVCWGRASTCVSVSTNLAHASRSSFRTDILNSNGKMANYISDSQRKGSALPRSCRRARLQ